MSLKINTVGVIGSGIMGGGIAAQLTNCGLNTVLLDIIPPDLAEDKKSDPTARNSIVDKGLKNAIAASPPLFMDKDLNLLHLKTGNLEDDIDLLKDCDMVIEVVLENMKVKQQLFEKLESVIKPGTIITTNTSGLPIDSLCSGRSDQFKKNFMGTHFFNPVRYMKLLEIIPGTETDKELLARVSQWGEEVLGKGIVQANDRPNFIGNRIGVSMICKALHLLNEYDVPIPIIDKMLGTEFGFPRTGVFALTDLVGLDTVTHLADNSYELLPDDEEREMYKLPDFFSKMIEKKMLGNKTAETGGFFKTTFDPKTWKRNKTVLNKTSLEFEAFDRKTEPLCITMAKKLDSRGEKQRAILFNEGIESEWAWKLVSHLLVYTANRIPEISDSIVDIDNAMKWGYNWETGPFEIWDNIGLKDSIQFIENEGHRVPDHIHEMIHSGAESFYKIQDGILLCYDFSFKHYVPVEFNSKAINLAVLKESGKKAFTTDSCTLVDLGDGVFNLEFHTKMNTMNQEILESLGTAIEHVNDNGTGLVIGNQAMGVPGAFSAGADIAMMIGLAKEQNFSGMDTIIKNAHTQMMALRYTTFPVVTAPFGMALGGGCEICLASDRIVAHGDLYMGLVEVGAGLIPGAGGCTNLWRKVISMLPRSIEITDLAMLFKPVFQTIAMAKVSTSAADARNIGYLNSQDRIVMNRDLLIGEAKREVLKMVDDGYRPPAAFKVPVLGEDAIGMVHAQLYNLEHGKFITEYDSFIAKKLAHVLSGGTVPPGTLVSEEDILSLERETFISLWKENKTMARAEHILKTGKPLRN